MIAWIPIVRPNDPMANTLPPEGEDVFVCYRRPRNQKRQVSVGWFSFGTEKWYLSTGFDDHDHDCEIQTTHWAPLAQSFYPNELNTMN
jgi:hypothetical protein